MKVKTFILVAFFSCMPTMAHAAGAVKIIKVAVVCSGDDSIGSRLCYEVKEQIRASRHFELVSESATNIYEIRLISTDALVDPQLHGISSGVAVVITHKGVFSDVQTYERGDVYVVGSSRTKSTAEDIVASLDDLTSN